MTGLYLHIPFCRSKCAYCDFFSLDDAPLSLANYVELLLRQMTLLPDAQGSLASIFFGGGTPSLLEPDQVATLLTAIDRRYGFAGDIEITLEGNPDSLDAAKLAGYRATGVNRLSIGLQSLDDHQLLTLGRRHDAASGLRTVVAAREAGFTNLSCDLMFHLPGQSLSELEADLGRLLELAPEHLSIYGLSIEEGTPFFARQQRGELQLADDEAYVAAYRQLHRQLRQAGYRHYEISNFARPGYECRHNLGYWQRRDCLALGAGAHGFVADGFGRRYAAVADLQTWADTLNTGCDPGETIETFDHRTAMAETLYLGLRTAAGVDDAAFTRRFGCSVAEAYPQAVARCAPHLHCSDGCWRLDLDGWLLFDTLLQHFF